MTTRTNDTTTTVDASQIGFGVEYETHIPIAAVTPGPYHRGYQVPWLPNGWKAERDCSIGRKSSTGWTQSFHGTNRQGCEFVSPILKGAEGIREALASAKEIEDRGGKVNASCGLHVTVSFNGDKKALKRLINMVANLEVALYAVTGTRRRQDGNHPTMHSTCDGIAQHGNATRTQRNGGRYITLNLNHVRSSSPRVEFRIFAATLSQLKLAGYIRICLGLVERAINTQRATPWQSKLGSTQPGPWLAAQLRKGIGYAQVARMFRMVLGWTKGTSKTQYGMFAADGTPTCDEIKTELFRLASKYDAECTRRGFNDLDTIKQAHSDSAERYR